MDHLVERSARAGRGSARWSRFGVPDVRALGDVPTDPAAVDAYLVKLDAVSRALTRVQTAYADALADREEVIGFVGALAAQSRAAGRTDPDLDSPRGRLDAVLAATPTDLPRAKALLTAYQALDRALPTSGSRR